MSVPDGFDVVPVRWSGTGVDLLDQRLLPATEEWLHLGTPTEVAAAIRDLAVRGAPAIGIAAGYGVALAAMRSRASDPAGVISDVLSAGEELAATRPTAVNLAWALQRVAAAATTAADTGSDRDAVVAATVAAAAAVADSERAACRRLGALGAELVGDGANVLTHCNAGALATGGYGTALGVVRAAVEAGKDVHVWVDETRPVLQGARLTAWELDRAGIANTLVVDSAAASLMSRGLVDVCVVGADRIAANGDTANKIGTYAVALAAAAHAIPFLVAAPVSTIDLDCPGGSHIAIEERAPSEVTLVATTEVAPTGQVVANPAFDVTPARLITAIVTEAGIARPPYGEALAALLA
ncbi:MAG: S-methyl-5-thioribose-1-phosphate isomerase [Acidimicrobiia bacterium]